MFLLSLLACAPPVFPGEDSAPCEPLTWYPDLDGDGLGDGRNPIQACEAPEGALEVAGDCNDADPRKGEAAGYWQGSVEVFGREELDAIAEACVTGINGALRIEDTELKTLEGLEEITAVGALIIDNNHRLESYAALSRLERVVEDLQLTGNGSDHLVFEDGAMDTSALPPLDPFTGLEQVGGDLRIFMGPTPLPPFPRLTEVGGDVDILLVPGSPSQSSYAGLGELRAVGGNLSLYGDFTLDGLQGLEEVGGGLLVRGSSLTSLEGFTSLERVGELVLQDNAHLVDVDGPEALVRIRPGLLIVQDNPALVDLEGLHPLNWVSGGVRITGNHKLQRDQIDALLDAIVTLQGPVEIDDNAP